MYETVNKKQKIVWVIYSEWRRIFVSLITSTTVTVAETLKVHLNYVFTHRTIGRHSLCNILSIEHCKADFV